MHSVPLPRHAHGMTLVELMIAMTLGLLLVLGVIQIFGAARASYSASIALAEVQETGRFALERLKPELRSAGTLGFCGGELPVRNHLNTGCPAYVDDLFDPGRSVTGWDFNGTGASQTYSVTTLDPAGVAVGAWNSRQPDGSIRDLPAVLANRVVPGTDVLVVRRLEPIPNVTAVGNTMANAAAINITAAHGTARDALLLVTNCTDAADLFQNTTAPAATALARGVGSCTNPGPGNVAPGGREWSTRYDNRMQIYRARMHAYYIGRDAASGEPGLYRFDLSVGTRLDPVDEAQRVVELAPGVENLQLRFGISLPGSLGGDGQSVNHWLTADRVTDWGLVVAVHASLLVRSASAPDGQVVQETINMAGTLIEHPSDNLLRKRFNTTVALRNRVIVL